MVKSSRWRMLGFGWIAVIALPVAAEETAPELVQMVVDLLGEKDQDLRALGLDQVRTQAEGQAATLQFAAVLARLPPESQTGLLSALADRGDVAARQALLDLLSSTNDESVKIAAIKALGPLGGPADLKLLVHTIASASKAEQAAARASLIRLRGESVPAAIAAEMSNAAAPLRVALIEILASRRALNTIPDILSAAVADNSVVRAAAMTALGQLAGPEQLPGMIQGVLKAEKGKERDAAERSVASVCGRITDAEKRAEPLLAAMDKLQTADRTALFPTLGRVGGPAALAIIEAAIADSDSTLHETGLRALCNWPDSSVAPRLIELARSDAHPAHRTLTLAALIRVAPLPDKRPPAEKLELLKTALTMCTHDDERNLVLRRARAIRTVETLQFLAPHMDQAPFAQQACESVVELAHHRELREGNKEEFHKALDKVLATSQDATVKLRADRYKKNQTWARPME